MNMSTPTVAFVIVNFAFSQVWPLTDFQAETSIETLLKMHYGCTLSIFDDYQCTVTCLVLYACTVMHQYTCCVLTFVLGSLGAKFMVIAED